MAHSTAPTATGPTRTDLLYAVDMHAIKWTPPTATSQAGPGTDSAPALSPTEAKYAGPVIVGVERPQWSGQGWARPVAML
ncbi:hypothetical protein J6590_055448 [Homalodisca vitripennis]|nr:hypothetical protein J6590_055448 [Homalodisca vitripennis]